MNEDEKITPEEAKPEDTKPTEKEQEEKQTQDEAEKKYSDKDLDEIIGKKLAKWKKDEEKKVSEAKKLASMNEAEKARYEKEQLQEELDKLRAENTRNEMLSISRGMLQEKDIAVNDELISMLITDEAEKTKANVNSFIESFNKAVEKSVNEKLKSNPPKRMVNPSTKTKEEILAIKDPVERRNQIAQNIELFN